MNFFGKIKEPVFLKVDSHAGEQLDTLKKLEPTLNAEGVKILKQDIRNLEYGIAGEKTIEFELKNSHMPMVVLHDIYLEEGDLSAQIDYLVFTRKLCIVIECKNLYGNIEINNAGDFIRTTEFNRSKKKEGIYSPITQNQRHLDLMKKISINRKRNILTKTIAKKSFDDFNKSLVVLSNPKTVLNARYAKKEVKDKVLRADQLVNYIKELHKQSKELASSERDMISWAQSYLDLHKEGKKDYTSKYESFKLKTEDQNGQIKADITVGRNQSKQDIVPVNKTELFKELKEYRLFKSREEKIKAYHIFSNRELEALIEKMPKSTVELQTVQGFGTAKTSKYSEDIVRIIEKY